MLNLDPRLAVFFSARNIFIFGALFFIVSLCLLPASPAQALLAGFFTGAGLWLWLISRGQLQTVKVTRAHRPRIFEDERVELSLRVARGDGLPLRLLEVQDQFQAGLDTDCRHLVPILSHGWEVLLHDKRQANRHRGLYLLGPVLLRAADPLGVFFEEREVDCITRLTVYPKANPLPGYVIPGPEAQAGPSLDYLDRLGQGEEILSVREYRPGDPPSRIHWHTSARRRRLHVLQLNCPIQVELAVLLDLTRRSRLGLGAESTTEMAIQAAVSILTRGHEACHRLSLGYVQQEPVFFPAGSGLAHLHLLLDHLAVLNPAGEADFWAACGPRALMLSPGSRAVLIVSALNTPREPVCDLVKLLTQSGVGVDLVLINEREFIKIYRDQEVDLSQGRLAFAELCAALSQAGARVFPLQRHQSPAQALDPAP